MKVAVVGAGWAGMAAAVQLTGEGAQVTVFEATRTLGGRARGLDAQLPDGRAVRLDNGQHILIGAYTASLGLMQRVGVDLQAVLQRLPLTLKFPDGAGLQLPPLPAPLDALAGIAGNRSWPLRERLGLIATALRWRLKRFECAPELTVAQLCARVGPAVMRELIEPLCVSALNTPASQASAQVFLRTLQDALFATRGGSELLLPRVDLSALFPLAAQQWLADRGALVHMGRRVRELHAQPTQWLLDDEPFDAVILACPPSEAARLAISADANAADARPLRPWAETARALNFEAIATVYAWASQARLNAPMLALRHDAGQPAQFVFDRGQLGSPPGLLAFVVSASRGERELLQAQVLRQAQAQLGLDLQLVQTVVEKQATFACTPALQRPSAVISPGLLACGDYVAGPYPATLEGAVRSGLAAAQTVLRQRSKN